jgi:K+-transporting ATPase ATPase C chain
MTMTTEAEPDEPSPPNRTASWELVRHEARQAFAVTLVLAFLAGVLFPAFVIGSSQLFFPGNADGSLLRDAGGRVIGSELIGQRFQGEEFFHGRPSGAGPDGYDASASSGLNLGPNNPELATTVEERAEAYRAENGLADSVELPADAVTTSASGLDPHISAANARLQVPRVARARGLPEATVRDLVERHVEDPALGFFGEPRVKVLRLNLSLEEVQ